MITKRDWIAFISYLAIVVGIIYKCVEMSNWPVMHSLVVSLVLSVACALVCFLSIPELAKLLIAAGLGGKDCHKTNSPVLAEASGVAVGFTYAIALTIFLPFAVDEKSQLGDLSVFLSALLSINSMCFLGFADNVLNLRWRHKLILPTIACLPVLLVYRMQGGSTYVLVPDVIKRAFFDQGSAGAMDFGIFYYIFLAMLSVFGTNAINILAGVNGLEVGQSIVITAAAIVNVLIQMNRHAWNEWQFNDETVFSLYLLVPFLCCSLALWIFNKCPARVFVGDTYCYLAGTVLAVSGILGHFSKTMLLFMVPQVINFLYSIPQLFRLVPCPRHRMPAYIKEVDSVDVSFTDWISPSQIPTYILWLVRTCGVAKMERKGQSVRLSNFTVLNFILWKVGRPIKERLLVNIVLSLQISWIMIALILRFKAAGLLYSFVD
jgi:UDP-N-acetylglucosamine--dolichyl-phosphate N-acetylglucosaminephosphotransferase